MDELSFLSARELARRIKRRSLSSLALVDHFIARIERLNPALNAVITLDADGARAAAQRADAAVARGELLGPLHGVPMTIKDSFEVSGMRTTCGAPALRDYVPKTDAIVVQRLRAAGAILMGKTNTPLYCADGQTYNAVFGTTNNPWDVTRTPGGSSGGSAAALAAGFTPIEVGSDIAGSIRCPAHFCGVLGHKPTHGLIPERGHIPGAPGARSEADLGVMGPLARSADDLSLLFDVLAGPTPERATAWRLQLPAARSLSLRGYRVAAFVYDPSFAVDERVLRCLQNAVTALRHAGVEVTETKPDFDMSEAHAMYRRLLDSVMGSGLPAKQRAWLQEQADNGDPNAPLTSFARNALMSHREWLITNEQREQLRLRWARFFEDYDVLLTPVSIVPAFAHDQSALQPLRTLQVNGKARRYDDLYAWVSLATNVFLPATSVPVGLTPEGLPVGMQVIGPYLEDRTPIDFAARLHDLLGGFRAPPGY
jgi:amidase